MVVYCLNSTEQGNTTCQHSAEIFVLSLAIHKVTTRFFSSYGKRVRKSGRHYNRELHTTASCCEAELGANLQAIFVEGNYR
jgi:hypothetical protein